MSKLSFTAKRSLFKKYFNAMISKIPKKSAANEINAMPSKSKGVWMYVKKEKFPNVQISFEEKKTWDKENVIVYLQFSNKMNCWRRNPCRAIRSRINMAFAICTVWSW